MLIHRWLYASGDVAARIYPCARTPILHPRLPTSGEGVRCESMTLKEAFPVPRHTENNMRSKSRWFAEFCNSHYVSHFAAFFIVARAKISVVESFGYLFFFSEESGDMSQRKMALALCLVCVCVFACNKGVGEQVHRLRCTNKTIRIRGANRS